MKNLFALALVCFAMMGAHAQKLNETEVPVIIKNAFAKMYPGIKKAGWTMQGNLYQAYFAEGNYKGSVLFADNGKWTERETAVPVNAVPSTIKNYLDKNYADRKITEATKVTNISKVVHYKIVMDNMHLLFTNFGELIQVLKE